jgi:membrane associated rhomboid family serine protease
VGILDEIKESFRNGSYLTRLIYINIAVWIAIRIVYIFFFLSGSSGFELMEWLALPASLKLLIFRPWTLFTYMFLHFEFLHILFNILWLYWFGRIFLEYHNQKKLLSVYILGGLAGGIFYMLAYNLFPVFQQSVPSSQLLGASASVIAIVIAISVYVPNHTINLMFIGPVKIKWIAVVSVVLYIIGLSGTNAGGDFAHLGGAFWGWLYMSQLMKGRNIASSFDSVSDYIFTWFKPSKRMNVKYGSAKREYDYNRKKNVKQENINKILDKIGKSGYDSLTKEEKDMLFKMGKGKQ